MVICYSSHRKLRQGILNASSRSSHVTCTIQWFFWSLYQWCSDGHKMVFRTFLHPIECPFLSIYRHPLSSAPGTTNLLFVSINSSVNLPLGHLIEVEYMISYVWLLLLGIMFLRFIHVVECVSTSFLFSFFFFLLFFLGPRLWRMEVLRLGVESEL